MNPFNFCLIVLNSALVSNMNFDHIFIISIIYLIILFLFMCAGFFDDITSNKKISLAGHLLLAMTLGSTLTFFILS